MLKNIFIKNQNRFQRFAEKKRSDGISELIFYDSKEKRFVRAKNRYREAVGFATVAIGSSALSNFERIYGDPYNNIFSPKLNIYLLILLPFIEITINFISNYIDNNKESEFSCVYLSIKDAEKIYWKSQIKDILISLLDIGIIIFLLSFVLPSGGRSAAIYFVEVCLLSNIPNQIEKRYTYKKIQKEMENK